MRKFFDIVVDESGVPIVGAIVRVRVQPSLGVAATGLASIYVDSSGTLPPVAGQVTTTTGGNYFFYVNTGFYTFDFIRGGSVIKTVTDVEITADVTSISLAASSGLASIGEASGVTAQAAMNLREMALPLFANGATTNIPTTYNAVRTLGYSSPGIGAALYVYDAAVDAAYVTAHPLTSFRTTNSRGFRLDLSQGVNPYQAGATGVNSQTLSACSYVSDRPAFPTTITFTTVDQAALNELIVLLRAAGGGLLRIPAGVFSTYGYLQRIDFPLKVEGAGRGIAIIRNTAASPMASGYGIFIVESSTLANFELSGVTLDGNVQNRPLSVGEWRAYPIAIYGRPQANLHDFESINSPIDNLTVNFRINEAKAYVNVSNFYLGTAYRLNLSLIEGNHINFVNGLLEDAGFVQGGAGPKTCIDIEPDAVAEGGGGHGDVKNITFTNVHVRKGANGLLAGVWCGNVRFNTCSFENVGASVPTDAPWATISGGEFTFTNCKFFNGETTNWKSRFIARGPETTGNYINQQFVRLVGCDFEGGGFEGLNSVEIENTTFRNSLFPVLFGGAGTQRIDIVGGLRLINVVDSENFCGGLLGAVNSRCSFHIESDVEGRVCVNGVRAEIDTGQMPADFLTAATAVSTLTANGARGIYIGTPPAASAWRIVNIHAGGYYRKLPTALGVALDTTKWFDWTVGAGTVTVSAPPADTAGTTTAKAATFFRDASMYGDFT